MEPTFS